MDEDMVYSQLKDCGTKVQHGVASEYFIFQNIKLNREELILLSTIQKSGIYCIENMTTHKKYIGQSIDIHCRWNKHISELNNEYHHNDYLQKAWNKYGQEDFVFVVLEYCSQENLDERERYYIDLYDTTNRDLGYNLKQGGQFGGGVFIQEVREKLSDSIQKSYEDPNRHIIQSQRAKEFWSRPEYREGHSGVNAPMYGHHHTDEVKQRLREFHKGKSFNRKYKDKVLCVEMNTIYKDAHDAAEQLSLDSSCIIKVCKGERYTCGGYHWQFITEENLENKVS